ncbi:Calx-beta domain-containing protein [Candidatus Poriferisodalis sp.]|uniref:Calx-beta domain-containing protein n=2 Tax=Candidatus Poriferisodalis sp. TaxID=3101277 RepID=UPI003B01AC7A
MVSTALTLPAQPAQAQDDNRPSVQFAEVTYVIEENDASGLNVGVTISPALTTASRVKFTTSGPAIRNVDYTVTGLRRHTVPGAYGAVTHTEYVDLPAGATQVLLQVRVIPDDIVEENEDIFFTLTSIDTTNAPYKIGAPASTNVVMLDNLNAGIKQDHLAVSGALPWTATLTVRDVSHERGSDPMVVRKQKGPAGQYIPCGATSEWGAGAFGANERCQNNFVYERVALSEVTGTTSFPMVGCQNGKSGGQCLPQGNNALSDNGFVDGGSAHRVLGVVLSGGTLSLSFDRPLSDALKAVAKLTVDGSTEFRLADATGIDGSYQWGNTGLSWTTDPAQSVSLRLERVSQQRGGEGPSSGDEEQRDPLTASFEKVPATHDGQSAFTLDVRLSETVGKFSRSPRASSFAVTQGRVTGVEQIGAGLWRVTVRPASPSAVVTVTLAGGRDCDHEPSGAVCARDGRALSNTSYARVAADPQQQQAVLTTPRAATQTVAAAFGKVPAEHDGRTAFALDVQSGAKPAADAFTVTNGTVTGVESLDPVLWRVRVKPKSWKDVTVALGDASAKVPGPARIRAQDARAKEGKHASLDFTVTLSRAASGPVSVHYATNDGTAAAGADYTAASGTLTFAPGETHKTVSVTLLDDAINESKETLTLKLSNPQGAFLRAMHRNANGIIKNDDP